MKYLLDTCCISDFVKGQTNTVATLKNHRPLELAISSVTVMEIQYGLILNPQRARKIKKIIDDLLACIHIIAFNKVDAFHAAKIRSYLRKRGIPIGSYDILIAGCALRNNLILVTSNESEFKRVPNLKLENWRSQVPLEL
jgi:tRNA(fMet)-specific endonuclease VapC